MKNPYVINYQKFYDLINLQSDESYTYGYKDGLSTAYTALKKLYELDSDTIKSLFGDYLVDKILQNHSMDFIVSKLNQYENDSVLGSLSKSQISALLLALQKGDEKSEDIEDTYSTFFKNLANDNDHSLINKKLNEENSIMSDLQNDPLNVDDDDLRALLKSLYIKYRDRIT